MKKHAKICNGPGSKPRKEKQAKPAIVNHPAVANHPAIVNHPSPVPDTQFEPNRFQQHHGAYQQQPYNFSLPGFHFNAYK